MTYERRELPMIASGQQDRAPCAPAPGAFATPGDIRPPGGEAMVVRDPAMVALMRRVALVAASRANVLITGESGAGKERIAACIHDGSPRRADPFVVLNCAALPEALLANALLAGAAARDAPGGPGRRDAAASRIGLFEAARGGTLLLDEVGELDLCMQARMLGILQQRELDRARGNGAARDDVRIVATTSKNLQEEVRMGRFRAALFFRLNVLTVKVPPLRERPADIAALAEEFAAAAARAGGLPARALSPDSLALLSRHSWPGNVRELANVMHRAALIATGPSITPAALELDLPDDAGPPDATPGPAPGLAPAPPAATRTAGRTIEAVEKDMILDTLLHCKGNRGQTATILGISIRTLRNKLHEYERGGTRIPRPVIIAVA
jgi:DNA-binding NtrC family response regulator